MFQLRYYYEHFMYVLLTKKNCKISYFHETVYKYVIELTIFLHECTQEIKNGKNCGQIGY